MAQDDALRVECLWCGAKQGVKCKDRQKNNPHATRVAMAKGSDNNGKS